jgi:hypothetical protein
MTTAPPGPNDAPRPTGRAWIVDLAGFILPVDAEGQPAWILIEGLGLAIPIFSSLQTLWMAAAHYPRIVVWSSLKRIDETRGFLESIPVDIPIVADVRPSERGTVLYTDVRR